MNLTYQQIAIAANYAHWPGVEVIPGTDGGGSIITHEGYSTPSDQEIEAAYLAASERDRCTAIDEEANCLIDEAIPDRTKLSLMANSIEVLLQFLMELPGVSQARKDQLVAELVGLDQWQWIKAVRAVCAQRKADPAGTYPFPPKP